MGKDSGGPSVAKSVPAGANVYVCNLPVAWVETDLQKAFQAFGQIVSLTVARNNDGSSSGYGFVGYDSAADAKAAAESMNGARFDDGTMLIAKLKDDERNGQ